MTAISVVMGVYNGGATLAATLDSILAQTEHDFELIVVDDGSTDATSAILHDYAGRDSRIRVIRKENEGLTRALIDGCAAARGTFIARHDAGDLSHPSRFAVQRQALDRDAGITFVSCATQYSGPALEPLYVARPSGAALTATNIIDTNRPHLLSDGPTHHGSVMFRRDAYERVGGYRVEFHYGQDFDLWFRLAEVGKYQALAEVLYTARLTADSISAGARPQQERLARYSRAAFRARLRGESDAAIVTEAASVSPPRERTSRCRRARGYYFIGEALRRNGDARARGYLRSAILACPLHLAAWFRYAQLLLSYSGDR